MVEESTREGEQPFVSAEEKNFQEKINDGVNNSTKKTEIAGQDYLVMDEKGIIQNLPQNPKKVAVASKSVETEKKNILRNSIMISGILVLVVVSFFLGRFSVNSLEVSEEITEGLTGAVASNVSEGAIEETGEINYTLTDTNETKSKEEGSDGSQLSADIENSENTETSNEEETETKNEPITKDYEKVAVSISTVNKEWMETWGRITQIGYTIKNSNTAGAVEPERIIMRVEGYDDEGAKKIIPLPPSSQYIGSGKSVSKIINVPNKFSYSRQTAGNLDNVRITVVLYDKTDEVMATFSNEFNLNG
jgi:hypothetical protein